MKRKWTKRRKNKIKTKHRLSFYILKNINDRDFYRPTVERGDQTVDVCESIASFTNRLESLRSRLATDSFEVSVSRSNFLYLSQPPTGAFSRNSELVAILSSVVGRNPQILVVYVILFPVIIFNFLLPLNHFFFLLSYTRKLNARASAFVSETVLLPFSFVLWF